MSNSVREIKPSEAANIIANAVLSSIAKGTADEETLIAGYTIFKTFYTENYLYKLMSFDTFCELAFCVLNWCAQRGDHDLYGSFLEKLDDFILSYLLLIRPKHTPTNATEPTTERAILMDRKFGSAVWIIGGKAISAGQMRRAQQ